jgi:hypothetical protein
MNRRLFISCLLILCLTNNVGSPSAENNIHSFQKPIIIDNPFPSP